LPEGGGGGGILRLEGKSPKTKTGRAGRTPVRADAGRSRPTRAPRGPAAESDGSPSISIGLKPRPAARTGDTIELLVSLWPAPPEGAVVAISAPWRNQPVAEITLQPGTGSGQTTLAIPPNAAPGDHLIETQRSDCGDRHFASLSCRRAEARLFTISGGR
jgi:hypothetical protein